MTREEAIVILDGFKHNPLFNEQHFEALDMAISALSENNSVANKGEWIPVTERLPEKKVKDYLACCEDGYVATIMYDNGRWLINDNNVIAWMPLPEPYKKGGE